MRSNFSENASRKIVDDWNENVGHSSHGHNAQLGSKFQSVTPEKVDSIVKRLFN
jgi:hypothetical protein